MKKRNGLVRKTICVLLTAAMLLTDAGFTSFAEEKAEPEIQTEIVTEEEATEENSIAEPDLPLETNGTDTAEPTSAEDETAKNVVSEDDISDNDILDNSMSEENIPDNSTQDNSEIEEATESTDSLESVTEDTEEESVQDTETAENRADNLEEYLYIPDTYYLMEDGAVFIYFEINYESGKLWAHEATVKIGTQEYTLDCYGSFEIGGDDDKEESGGNEESGKGKSSSVTGYFAYRCKAEDLQAGTYDMEITVNTDTVDEPSQTVRKTSRVTVKKLEQSFQYSRYIQADDTYLSFNVYLLDTECTPIRAYLVDASDNDKVVAVVRYDLYSENGDVVMMLPTEDREHQWPYYESGYGCLYQCQYLYGSLYYISGQILSGSYDLIVETSNKTYRFENYATAEYSKGLVTSVSCAPEYDNSRDYFHIYVHGEGLEYDKFYPVLKLEDGTVITEYVSHIGYIYKLKKLDGFVPYKSVSYELVTTDGYELEYYDGCARTVFTADGIDVLYISYNAKTKKYLLHTSAEVPDNTQMEIILTKDWPEWDYGSGTWNVSSNPVYAKANVTVTGMETEVNFQNDGKFVEIPKNESWYYGVKWTEGGNIRYAQSFIRHTESGYCEDASFSLGSDTRFKNVNEIPVKFYLTGYEGTAEAGDTVTVSLSQNTTGGVQGVRETIQLTLEADAERNDRLVCTGTFTSQENYPVGTYRLKPSCTGINDGSYYTSWQIYICGEDTFYQGTQGSYMATYDGRDCVRVTFTTADTNLDESKFKIEFFDFGKHEISTAQQIGKDVKPEKGTYNYYFSGIGENYRLAYVKVTYDGELGVSLKNTEKSYYAVENDSEEYGDLVWYDLYTYFGYETNVGICNVRNDISGDYDVDILNDYDGTLITSFHVKEKGVYYFTEEDISKVREIDPNLEELYTLVIRKDNKTYMNDRAVSCNIGIAPAKGWSYVVEKTTLTVGETTSVTVTGNKATPVFQSSDEGVFKVTADSADKNKATITAVAAGIAELSITADGETKKATITVEKKVIAPTGIVLSQTEQKVSAGTVFSLRASLQPVGASGSITFETSDPTVVSVEDTTASADGLTATLYAVNQGETVITASVGGTMLSASCKVIVQGAYTDEEKESEIAKVGTLYAVINETAVLGEVALPEGWSWTENAAAQTLVAYDNTPTQRFSAVYTRDGYEAFTAMLPVAVTEIIKIEISGSDEITQEETQRYAVEIFGKGYQYQDGEGIADAKANVKFAWSASGGNLALAENDTSVINVTAKKVQAATDEKMSVTMTIGKTEFKADKTIKILSEHIGSIVITPKADKKTSIYKEGTLYAAPDAGEIILNISAMKNGESVSVTKGMFLWSSSDSSIAVVTEQADGSAVLKVSGSGITSVTAKATDEIGKECELIVCVGEFTPILEADLLSLNAYSADGVVIPVYANGGNDITKITLNGSSNFRVEKNENGAYVLFVSAGKENAVGTKETVKFTAVTEIGKNFDGELTVAVNKKLPKVTFRAIQKANTFYKNAQVIYKVSAAEKIENIATGSGGSYRVTDYNAATGTLKLNRTGTDAVASLKVKLEGYKEITQDIKVAVQVKKPSYTIDEMYLSEGQLSNTTRVMLNKTGKVSLSDDVKAESLTTGVTAKVSDGMLALTLQSADKKSISYQVKLTSNNWNEPLTLKGKISIGKQPDQMLLSENKVIINNAYSSAQYGTVDIDAYVKNSTKRLDNVNITPEVTGMSVSFNKEQQQIMISYNGSELNTGTYKFTLKGVIDGTTTLKKAATLTVTVADGAKADSKKKAQVMLSGKGSINLVDREGTSIVYTAKLVNISGTVVDAELVDSEHSGYFKTYVTEDNKIELQAVQDMPMQTKTPYLLRFKVKLNNGITVISPEVKVKAVNKPTKAKASINKATIYKSSTNKTYWFVTSGNCKISSMELVKDKNNISDNFVLTSNGGSASLTLKDSAKKTLPAGKYNISYRVMMEGEATDAKAVTLKITVTVK